MKEETSDSKITIISFQTSFNIPVLMFKDELRESVMKKKSNRLGDFMDNEFYLVSTLCDPRNIGLKIHRI